MKPKYFLLFTLFMMLGCNHSEVGPSASKSTDELTGIQFTEDLSFGGGDAAEYVWGSPLTSISADDQGNIYVCDPQDSRILQFDPNGKYLATIGRKGEGPGEFQQLISFRVLMDGSAVALDLTGGIHPKLKFFDKNMKFVEERNQTGQPMIIQWALLSPSGNRFASFYVQPNSDNNAMNFNTAALDTNFQIVNLITSRSGALPDRSRFEQPGYWSERIADNITGFYKGSGIANFDSNGNLYTAVSNIYQITKWHADLTRPERLIEHDYKPISNGESDREAVTESFIEEVRTDPDLANMITTSVIRQAVDKAEIPPSKHPVMGIIPMEDGHLLVVHDVNIATRQNTAHIFSSTGDFQGEVVLENNALVQFTSNGFIPRMIFKGPFAYTLVTDASGENKVVRYRFKFTQKINQPPNQ